MTPKRHDLVVISRQPDTQSVSLVGTLAVVKDVQGDLCDVAVFDLSGQECGGGVVPASCLDSAGEVSAPWRAAYAVYKNNALLAEAAERDVDPVARGSLRRLLRLVGARHHIGPKKLLTIIRDLEAVGVVKWGAPRA